MMPPWLNPEGNVSRRRFAGPDDTTRADDFTSVPPKADSIKTDALYTFNPIADSNIAQQQKGQIYSYLGYHFNVPIIYYTSAMVPSLFIIMLHELRGGIIPRHPPTKTQRVGTLLSLELAQVPIDGSQEPAAVRRYATIRYAVLYFVSWK